MDIHKAVLPRDWHVTIVTSVSRQPTGTRDGASACGELSCQPRQEFHSKSHNASLTLLLASLADGDFLTGKAQADVTSGTGALCGWQAREMDRKRNIEQRAARTEKQQQRRGRITKGAGLSSGGNGDANDNFVFHHYEDYHLHMQHYRYYHTVSHAGRACADLLLLDATPQSTCGLNAAQEQSRQPAHIPASPAATATLPEITTTVTTTTVSTTTSTTVTTPFILARAPSCLTEPRQLSCADVSLPETPTPRAVTPPAILTSWLRRRGLSRSWSQSWGQYKKFCRLREALTHQQKRRQAGRGREVGDCPRAGDDKGDNVKRDDNSDITKITQDKGANGGLVSMKTDFQKVVEEPVVCLFSGLDGRCEAGSSQCQVLRLILSQADDQSPPAAPQHNPPPVDDAGGVHPVSHTVKWVDQDCGSHQHQNSPDNFRSVGLPEDPNVPDKNVSLEFAELTGDDGKSASDPVCGHSGSVRTKENDLWTASQWMYADRFSQIDWFTRKKKKKGLGEKPLPDGTHDKNESPDKKLELELDCAKSAKNSRNSTSNIHVCQGDESDADDKQAALERKASNPNNKKVAAAHNRCKHDDSIRKSPGKSTMRLSFRNISDWPVEAFTSGHAHPKLPNSPLIRRALEHTASLPPRFCGTTTHEVDACTNANIVYSPFKPGYILSNKHLDDGSRKKRSSTMTSKSLSSMPFSALPAVGKSFVPKALLHSPVTDGSSPSTGEFSLLKPELNVRASYNAPATTTFKPAPLQISTLCLHTSKIKDADEVKELSNFQLNSEIKTLLSCADEAPAVCQPLFLKSTPTPENSLPWSDISQVFSLRASRQTNSQWKPELGMESFIHRDWKHFAQKNRRFHGQSVKKVKRGSVQS